MKFMLMLALPLLISAKPLTPPGKTPKPPKTTNTAPVVKAGFDKVVTDSNGDGVESIQLAGSAIDAENNIVSYRILRNGVQLQSSTSASLFQSSIPLAVGSHTITLEATDDKGAKGSDDLNVTINALPPVTPDPEPVSGTFRWKPLRLGAGGYLTGIDISPDASTMVVRADTYGAYIWNSSTSQWDLIVKSTSLPAMDVKPMFADGVYEIKVAPSMPNRLYMAYAGFLYRSENRGANWERTSLPNTEMLANNESRTWGQKMAVDPVNANIVFLGTSKNGLFMTSDAGNSWRAISDIPNSIPASNGTLRGFTGINIHGGSAQNGRSQIIYAASNGNGVYKSMDGGMSWSATAGGPLNVVNAKIASDGILYAADNASSIWKYESGGWSNITPVPSDYAAVIVDPFNPARILVAQGGGAVNVSNDRGATWSGFYNNVNRSAIDIPWLGWANEGYMSVGDILFHPQIPNKLLFSQGIGMWTALLPSSPASLLTWNSQSRGIEQLCVNQIIAPEGISPVVSAWDRPLFKVDSPDQFPLTHGPDRNESINMGWAIDSAPNDPNFIAAIINWGTEKSGYSTDGGRTWNKFASYPPFFSQGKLAGGIAVSNRDNMVWAPNNNGRPYYTTDGGASWKASVFPADVPVTGSETGFGWAYFFKRYIITADKVLPNTFYIFNYLKGVYRSTDGGANFQLMSGISGFEWTGFHAKMFAVPGKAGHLYFTSGPQGGYTDAHPAMIPLRRSRDGGVTWENVPNTNEIWAFGYGKAAPGRDYPTIFVAGWVAGKFGVHRSDDDAQTWTFLGAHPIDSMDHIVYVSGDMNEYGKVYVALGGSGAAYGKIEP